MAVKNHLLDDLIINAAKQEFLTHGFQGASLHKIVESAGITTGALYTRYSGKDDLFASLIKPLMDAYKAKFSLIQAKYMEVHDHFSPDLILEVIHEEMEIFSDVLFEHYDDCLLLYCKSQGSSVEKMLNQMMDYKVNSTLEYFKTLAKDGANLKGIDALLTLQFHFYREILEKNYTREEALAALKLIYIYEEAGWKAIFNEIF